jgi:hypothetical protein
MAYNSITRKTCKCGCSSMPTIGFEGYFHQHAPKEVLDRLEVKQKRKIAAKNASAKLARGLANEDDNRDLAKNYGALDRWFREVRKNMTGKCMNCGGKTEAFTKNYKCSIAHILPKAYFKSVATNNDNWLELCFYGNSCHSQMDNKMLDLIDMNCFDTIIKRFAAMCPNIAQDEKRRIPPILIEYLKVEL